MRPDFRYPFRYPLSFSMAAAYAVGLINYYFISNKIMGGTRFELVTSTMSKVYCTVFHCFLTYPIVLIILYYNYNWVKSCIPLYFTVSSIVTVNSNNNGNNNSNTKIAYIWCDYKEFFNGEKSGLSYLIMIIAI